LLLALAAAAAAAPLAVQTRSLQASFANGTLVGLTDRAGQTWLRGDSLAPSPSVVIQRDGQESLPQVSSQPDALDAAGGATCRYSVYADLPGASAQAGITRDTETGDVGVTLACQAPQKGVAGVEWRIGPIPAELNLIVPGYGGMKMTAASSTTRVALEYPMFWEAQLLIVEGPGGGFYVWADDATGRYKRLTVTLMPSGWWLGLTTWNRAPFADLDTCLSVTWRLNAYAGDWRVPARRYREWAARHLPPVAAAQPSWVQDTRCVAIFFDGPDRKTLEMLAGRVDPSQTLVYVPDWRPEGYDRLYPTYDPVPAFAPFVERAHALGFRVMPHLNYFGCDPEHPLYQTFKDHHVRSPWGSHELQWFVWDDPSNPANNRRLAYINPAHKAWRDLLLARIRTLRQAYGVDAVYLDQTLNLYNDGNGLCDGATMIEGNLALGREIRAAVPELAIGGEGLNEVTARYQAFCQRHAWGIDFARSSWNKPQLKLAHPISTYLFQPTQTFNYLGVPSPDRAQYFAAWRENLMRWGALPTLMLYDSEAKPLTGFLRQILDEVRFWQTERVDADLDGAWPAEVLFPYRTAQGLRAARLADGSLRCGDRQVSQTLTDVAEVRQAGLIEGALCYDRERIFGLNPGLWYPCFADARDLTAFHVEALPAGVILDSAALFPGLAVLTAREPVVADLPALMAQATTGAVRFDGTTTEVHGPLNGEDGSQFAGAGDQVHAHPPWKTGTGTAYARWTLRLPARSALRFTAKVALDSGAVGKADALGNTGVGVSDGVLFWVAARRGDQSLRREVFSATAEGQPLVLDLTPFSGEEITLELGVDPGPRRNVTADWARWYGPRVVDETVTTGPLVLVDLARRAVVLSGTTVSVPAYVGARGVAEVTFPGTVLLLRDPPVAVSLPTELLATPFLTAFTDAYGQVLTAPAWAAAATGPGVVGGVERQGLRVQPPDQGQTTVAYALTLPAAAARFRGFVGLQDGSTSTGVAFIVQANGTELARQSVRPGDPWREVTADLSPWSGKTVVLSLVTDSEGPFGSDWARWGEPRLVP